MGITLRLIAIIPSVRICRCRGDGQWQPESTAASAVVTEGCKINGTDARPRIFDSRKICLKELRRNSRTL